MNVLEFRPGRDARLTEVDNTLKALQEAVGGYIECVSLGKQFIAIVNEEGKLQNLLPSVALLDDRMQMLDIFCGNVIVCRRKGEEFTDLLPGDEPLIFTYLHGLRHHH